MPFFLTVLFAQSRLFYANNKGQYFSLKKKSSFFSEEKITFLFNKILFANSLVILTFSKENALFLAAVLLANGIQGIPLFEGQKSWIRQSYWERFYFLAEDAFLLLGKGRVWSGRSFVLLSSAGTASLAGLVDRGRGEKVLTGDF